MKRLTNVLFGAGVLLLLLTGCGGSKEVVVESEGKESLTPEQIEQYNSMLPPQMRGKNPGGAPPPMGQAPVAARPNSGR